MPQSFCQEFNVSEDILDKMGVFNTLLDMDTRLFIRPELLKTTTAPELKNSYKRVLGHFSKIIKLLSKSSRKNDVMWRSAEKLFIFPEFEGLCIGYSIHGTSGSGIGPELRNRLLETSKEIIEKGIMDPEIFMLVGLFEKNIGCDRIGDMTGRIIRDDLINFSIRVTEELGILTEDNSVVLRGTEKRLLLNQYNGEPIILLPKDILDALPEALSWEDIDDVCYENETLRNAVNVIVGHQWSDDRKKLTKDELKKIVIRNPELLKGLINSHKSKEFSPYDYDTDPAGEINWHNFAEKFSNDYPLHFSLRRINSVQDVKTVVDEICEQFRDLIENNGLWKSLYNIKTKEIYHESYAQRLFFTIALIYCKANNIGISPESNSGRGPVDFKFNIGYDSTVTVELKLSTNNNLVAGFTKQLPEYQKAENAKEGVLVVLDFGNSPTMIKRLFDAKNDATNKKKITPEIFLVDARPKKPASKL